MKKKKNRQIYEEQLSFLRKLRWTEQTISQTLFSDTKVCVLFQAGVQNIKHKIQHFDESVPSYLPSQVPGSAECILGGIFTGHVTGGKEASTQLLWVLRCVGVISNHSANILQHLAVWKVNIILNKKHV